MFLIKKRKSAKLNAEQLLNQTGKKHPSEVFYKSAVLKKFTMFTGKYLYEMFKNICVRMILN